MRSLCFGHVSHPALWLAELQLLRLCAYKPRVATGACCVHFLQTRQELDAKTAEAASLNRQLHGSMEEVKQLEAKNTKLQAKVGCCHGLSGRSGWGLVLG